jgi:hypothetical protein
MDAANKGKNPATQQTKRVLPIKILYSKKKNRVSWKVETRKPVDDQNENIITIQTQMASCLC